MSHFSDDSDGVLVGSDGESSEDIDHTFMFNDLTQNEQKDMITPLLCGRSLNEKGEIIRKSMPIFTLKPIPSDTKYKGHFYQLNDSKINVYTMNTASQMMFASNGYYYVRANVEASYNAVVVNVSAKATYEQSSQHSSQKRHRTDTKSLFAECVFRQGQIVLSSACLELTARFRSDLTKLGRDQMSKETFHNMYGHWVDLSVTMGARIYTTQACRSSRSSEQDAEKEAFKASFETNVGWNNVNVKGGVSGGKSNNKSHNMAHRSKQTAMRCEAIGGDNLLIDQNNWTPWKKSIDKHNWSVIEVTEIRDVLQLTEFQTESRASNAMRMIANDSYVKPNEIVMNQVPLDYRNDSNRGPLCSDDLWPTGNNPQGGGIQEFKLNERYISKSSDHVMQTEKKDFYTLSYKEKRALITGTSSRQLLYGRTFAANGTVIPSSFPVFELREDPIKQYASHFQQINQMQQLCTVKYDEISKILVRSGYSCTDQHITGSMKLGTYANIGAKGGRKSDENHGSYSNGRTQNCQFVAQYAYPKGRISLNEQCVKVTDQYMKDYEAFKTNQMTKNRFDDRYGHWVDLVVVVGGKIYSEKSKSMQTLENEHKEKNEFASAFEAKLSTCISANADAGISNNDGHDSRRKNKEKHKMSSMNLLVIGGDAMSINEKNYTTWKESLNANPAKWEVIEICKTESVLNLTYFIQKDYPQRYHKLFTSEDKKNWNVNVLSTKYKKIYQQFVVQNNIWCICGSEMRLTRAKKCCDASVGFVVCDECKEVFTGVEQVFHCFDQTSNGLDKHWPGWNICKFCAC
eukprot:587411_1